MASEFTTPPQTYRDLLTCPWIQGAYLRHSGHVTYLDTLCDDNVLYTTPKSSTSLKRVIIDAQGVQTPLKKARHEGNTSMLLPRVLFG